MRKLCLLTLHRPANFTHCLNNWTDNIANFRTDSLWCPDLKNVTGLLYAVKVSVTLSHSRLLWKEQVERDRQSPKGSKQQPGRHLQQPESSAALMTLYWSQEGERQLAKLKAVVTAKHVKRGSRSNYINVVQRVIRNSSWLATHPVPTAGPQTQRGCQIHFTPRAARVFAILLTASCLVWSEILCINYCLFPKVPLLLSFLVISWNRTLMAEAPGSPGTTLAAPDKCKQVHLDKVARLSLLFRRSWPDLLFRGASVSFSVSATEVAEYCISFHTQPFLMPVIQLSRAQWIIPDSTSLPLQNCSHRVSHDCILGVKQLRSRIQRLEKGAEQWFSMGCVCV